MTLEITTEEGVKVTRVIFVFSFIKIINLILIIHISFLIFIKDGEGNDARQLKIMAKYNDKIGYFTKGIAEKEDGWKFFEGRAGDQVIFSTIHPTIIFFLNIVVVFVVGVGSYF